jgi:membrane protease YdiL (CAAX protease family)
VSDPAQRVAAPLARSTWLLIRLRLRRLVNQLTAASVKKAGGKTRTGNPGKKSSKVMVYIASAMMLLGFGTIARQSVVNLHLALDPPDTFWRTVEFSGPLLIGISFLLLVLWLSSVLLTIASGELAKGDWDLEWLITLPIRSDTLLWARILERSIVSPSVVIALLPACTVVAWYSGYRWSAPLLGVLSAWPLSLLAALGRTLLDTGLRLRMRAAQLRNLHAVISVLSIVVMYLAISMGLPGKQSFMLGIAQRMPDWLAWTPPGITVRALNERSFADALLLTLALIAQVGVLVWLGVRLLRHQLRHGVVAGGARDTARGAFTRSQTKSAPAASPDAAPGRLSLSAVQRRELTLLGRDRNFLVQSLVIPLLIVGGQLLLGTSGVATDMWRDANVLASVAFGLAAYSLSMSAFQTLNTEGHALWLLYTFPLSIEDVLKDKAKLWGALSLGYPLILFSIGFVTMPEHDWKFLGAMLTAFAGIPIYAFIAVALGVFGSNPLEQQQNQRVKPAYVYIYMTLAGLYIYAVVTPNLYQRVVFIVLTLLLAFALWQKARDQLPYLLDPDASPPPRVSTSDGLIAAMVFFVAQAVILAVMSGGGRVTGAQLLIAFTAGGAFTYVLMRWVYAKARTAEVPCIFHDASPGYANRPLLGIGAGVAASVIGTLYLLALSGTTFFEEAARSAGSYTSLGLWVLPLAIVAAPIFEEFIFRGLIFGGLRRSFGVWPAAISSAAIFALMHPPVSVLPVFVLGLATALVYERTRSLLAPMLAHAAYNACVIGAQSLVVGTG